jgi:Cys-tRNA synthase (O-phospho-L-seryl-tRNA:Cys-tRNA synthase)
MTLSAELVADVKKLLAERGKTQSRGESLEAYVKRGLGVTPRNARAFLGALEDGYSVDDAMLIAGIEMKIPEVSRLTRMARAIGAWLGSAMARLHKGAGTSSFGSGARQR